MRNAKASASTESTNSKDPLRVVEHTEPSETPVQTAPEATTETAPPKGGRKKFILLAVACVALALAARQGEHWWTVGRFIEETEDAYLQADIVSVSALVEGTVQELPVANNAQVSAGDVLLVLDPTTYEARLQSAQADVTVAETALANIDAKEVLQRARIASAEAEVSNAEAQRRLAATRDQRARTLVEQGTASQATADDTGAALDSAEAAVSRANAALQVEQGQITILASEREQQRASLIRAQAAERLAGIDLDNTTIVAPRDGIAGNIGVAVGEYLRPSTRFMSLVPTGDDIYITANFKETQVAAFHPGMPVEIEVDMLHGETLHGTIDSLAPATGSEFSVLPTDNATGNFTKIVQRIPVRIKLTEMGEQPLRAGASVVVSVDTRGGHQ